MSNARRHLKLCKGFWGFWSVRRGVHASYAQCRVPRFTFLLCLPFSLWPDKGESWHWGRTLRVLAGCIICGIWLGLSYAKSKCYLYAVRVRPPSRSWWRQMRQCRRRARLIAGCGSTAHSTFCDKVFTCPQHRTLLAASQPASQPHSSFTKVTNCHLQRPICKSHKLRAFMNIITI